MAKALTNYNNGEEAANPNLDYAVQVSHKRDEYEKRLQFSSNVTDTRVTGDNH
jgi:hypothetical protein